MSPTRNKTWVLKKFPNGMPVPAEDFAVEDRPIDLSAPPPPGGLQVEVVYASYDPYLRNRMREPSKMAADSSGFALGDAIPNNTVCRVLKSDTPEYSAGDVVVVFTGIAEYAVVAGSEVPRVRKISNPHGLDLALFTGPLGMPGLTAWSALHRIGRPSKGETLFVSTAAGAVGQVVGQVAKKLGLTVIGSVGSDEKVDVVVNEYGFDAAFNYKRESPKEALPRLAPNGIDIYFENVGGEHLEAALDNMNKHGRIPVCGAISYYNLPEEERHGVRNLDRLYQKQIAMEGFLVGEIGPAYYDEHQSKLQAWIADGSVRFRTHVTEGIDNAPDGFVEMLRGGNVGKAVLKIR